MSFLKPDRYFSRISFIDVERDILQPGFENVLLDIDNTILTRDTHEIPRDVARWLAKARTAGVKFCLLSNNWHHGVYELADRLELPLVAKAMKPLPPAFLMARHKLGGKRRNTLVVGDQLITDVLGAHVLGMKAYMLQPLVEQDLPHTLFLRNFERIIMGNRQPESAGAPQSVSQSVSQVVGQSASQSVGQVVSQTTSQSMGQSAVASVGQPMVQSVGVKSTMGDGEPW